MVANNRDSERAPGSERERNGSVKHELELELDDFAYDLPPSLIAQSPAEQRSSSRLMVIDRTSGSIKHHKFSDLLNFMQAGDVLILNDTKVIPARIWTKRISGGEIEILLIRPLSSRPGLWEAMANPLRRLKEGDQLTVAIQGDTTVTLTVAGFTLSEDQQRRVIIDFGGNAAVFELLSKIGQAPLPPYILREHERRQEDSEGGDSERYQTVFAHAPGAVAAPTAGLHFTKELLADLKKRGVKIGFVTLHVGPGTFKPISSSVSEHTIEAEEFYIPEETAVMVNEAKAGGKRVFAVGTTSCRALETAGATGLLKSAQAEMSRLYIRPGYKFAMVDALITNFHLSKSSLLVLVAAFAGYDLIMSAYKVAIAEEYRFYSYGDAMLIV